MGEGETRYLSVSEVQTLHDRLIARTGTADAPLRDAGLLESALMRPRMAGYYEGADLVRQTALLAVAISQAQAFTDGNKRAAYAAADVFLELNGLEYTGDPIELGRALEVLAERQGTLEEATERFEEWLRERVATMGEAS